MNQRSGFQKAPSQHDLHEVHIEASTTVRCAMHKEKKPCWIIPFHLSFLAVLMTWRVQTVHCLYSVRTVSTSFWTPRSRSASRSVKLAAASSRVFATASTMNNNNNNELDKTRIVFHWFRHGDLRLHDNPALVHTAQKIKRHASSTGKQASRDLCIPLFCFDPTIFGQQARTPLGNQVKCGPRRAQFIRQSVQDLQHRLTTQLGSPLVITYGHSTAQILDDFLTRLAEAAATENSKRSTALSKYEVVVVCQEEPLKEERDAVEAVNRVLQKHQPPSSSRTATAWKVESIWGSTLYQLEDLPFDAQLANMPDVFTPFRTKVEKNCVIATPLPVPRQLPPFPTPDSIEHEALAPYLYASFPTLKDLGYTEADVQEAEHIDPKGVMAFVGGETAALARMKEYIWDKDLLKVYFDTRNGMLGADYSSKFSPWLAHGCLSPRLVAAECRRYEEQVVANKSTYWLVFELLWRDFCKFFSVKHGNRIFYPGGTVGRRNLSSKWANNPALFEAWRSGRTGYPLVDANMRELAATGFMSNRGRQNVCSFLALELNLDWRLGGEWFESQLLDYDVYSNWVNWCAGAGLTGGRLNRFNILKQSKDYDQHGDYVRHWLPELSRVPAEFVHEPWKMTQFQQSQYQVQMGVDYPNPVLPPYSAGRRTEGDDHHNDDSREKQRKPNSSNRNRHQKYEMKSLKPGGYKIR